MSSEAPIDATGLAGKVVALFLVFLIISVPIGAVMAMETVDEGHVRVVKYQGATTGDTLGPGWHFIMPVMESTVDIPTRPQTYTMSHQGGEGEKASQDDSIRVLTNDGLHVDVDVTVRYRVTRKGATNFYEEYRNLKTAEARLIRPTVRSTLRTEAGNIQVTNIYTGKGQTQLKVAVEEALKKEFQGSGVVLEAVQVRNVNLPDEYAKAIEDKKVKEQKIQEAQYEIEVAKKEKKRQIIEAQADAEANSIRSKSLTKEVLAAKYIETLRQKDNVVYMPIGDGGYPQFVKNIEGVNNSTATSP